MSKSNPWPAEKRDAQLRKIVGQMAGKIGAKNITRRAVAKAADCSEALVSSYLGGMRNLQMIASREAKKLGLTPPKGKEEAAIGAKLRAHKPGDPRDTRKRTVKEVKAVKEKAVPAKPRAKKSATVAAGAALPTATTTAATDASSQPVSAPPTVPAPKPRPQSPNPPERKPDAPPERKTAARQPKAPPASIL